MMNIRHIMELYKHNKIKMVSESQYRQLWEVGDHTVAIQIKKGRRIITCDCKNHAMFCGSSSSKIYSNSFDSNQGVALCSHKEAVINFPIIEVIQGEINKKMETFKALALGSEEELIKNVIFEMEDLEKLLWVRQLKYL